jgi:hypothetical protein
MADAALVTADTRAARRNPVCITRLPATDSAGGRGLAEAVAHNRGAEVGVLAQTPPTQHRPGTCSKVAEGSGTFLFFNHTRFLGLQWHPRGHDGVVLGAARKEHLAAQQGGAFFHAQ